MDFISVIVPVYKVERYLEKCIKSILEQTYSEFELILIDDGSPDQCGKICDGFARKDKRIKVVHQENVGLSQARNVGIELALKNEKSQWITFIDSDDWVHPKYLENLYNAVKHYNMMVAVCEFVKTNDATYEFDNLEMPSEIMTPGCLRRKRRALSSVAWGKIYCKQLFEEIRYPIGKIHEDEFVTWKILFQLDNIVVIHNSLYVYFQREESIMHRRWTKEKLVLIEALEEELDFLCVNGYKREYLHTVGSYIKFMMLAIENLNRYYPKDEEIKKIKIRLRSLYEAYKRKLNLSFEERLIIFGMLLPINGNSIPWVIRKVKNIKEIYREHGVRGVANKIKNLMFNKIMDIFHIKGKI